MVTEVLRALRMLPIEAAVIPFPSDETTPPVTKTYFGNLDSSGGFSKVISSRGACQSAPWLHQEDLGLTLAGTGVLDDQLALGRDLGHAHLLEEGLDALQLGLVTRQAVVHRHHPARLDRPHHLGGTRRR